MTSYPEASPPWRIIMGPTAAGKSAIAMHLAEHYGLAIISADSRQVYRGFDIGTAKPTPAEQERVPHYGIDLLEPAVRYSAHQWASDARRWRADARAAGRDAVVVGGTGFYVRALVEPLDDAPSLDPDRRAALEAWLATLGGAELTRWCQRLDPARAALGRTQQRRAVETALLAGRRISASHAHARAEAPTVDDRTRYLVIDPGDELATRIVERVQAMMAAGWVDEVCGLMQRVPADAAAWNASGYRTIREAVAGGGGLERAVDRVIIETRQYAKRQRTWCRHQLPAAAVTALDSRSTDALARARAWWESEDGSLT